VSESTIRPETTEVLAEFWEELLDVDSVDQDDRVLELGGNSLIATMLANRIELAWGFRPTMEELMSSTFGELAKLCEQSRE
jgi:acyl carrier protein